MQDGYSVKGDRNMQEYAVHLVAFILMLGLSGKLTKYIIDNLIMTEGTSDGLVSQSSEEKKTKLQMLKEDGKTQMFKSDA